MGRSPCCEKVGLRKGTWTSEEDQKLSTYIKQHGHGSWRALPAKAGLRRCGKSCRLRWTNYLSPDIKRGKFNLHEEQTIIQLHALLGNRWSVIANHLPKRTDNEIKNYWNTHLKKKLTKMGIDPTTHKLKKTVLDSGTANLSHIAQWESARLEAEARLVRESKLMMSTVNDNYQSKSKALPPYLDILKAWQLTKREMTDHRDGFFNSNGSALQTPTSILHFSNNLLTISSTNISGFTDNLAKETVPNNCKFSGGERLESMNKTILQLNDTIESSNTPSDAVYLAYSLWEDPNLMEAGFDFGVFQDTGDGDNSINRTGPSNNHNSCYDGDLEDNSKYNNNKTY
ncbi:hypothetical protein ACH5RR_035892 [Cinchona calisaya]|uniref:Uncharacterized protein n=1 Tax=Cinchona calisaya TaxID=153742 RepID=A0ABD2Y2S5_9GENT